ncbi:MAG: ABC transporter ATP-binding protein [Flavobacteriaceae bacterium]
MRDFRTIMRYGLAYKGYAMLNIVCNIFYALFSALAFVSLIPMLNVLFKTTQTTLEAPTYQGLASLEQFLKDSMNYFLTQRLAENVEHTLWLVIGLVLLLFFLKNLANYFALFFITYFRNGILRDLRNALYQKIIELPVGYFSEKRKGDLMARMTTDVTEIQTSFLSVLELLVREPLTIVFTLGFMLSFSVKLTLFVLFFIPISGIVISLLGKKLKKHALKVQEEQGHFLNVMEETVNGQKIIKTFAAGNHFKTLFEQTTQRFFSLSNKLLNRVNLAAPASEFLGICVIGILLWFGGRMVLLENSLTGPEFIVYMGLAYNILTPAKAISKAGYSIQKGNAAAQRILAILTAENTVKESPDAVVKNQFNKAITFSEVSFGYDQNQVLNKLSFELGKGKTLALVGPSGGGKSTIANLLCRFYDVHSGVITLDDVPLPKIKKESLYQMMSVVTQEIILFNDTITQNLLLGNPKATQEELIEAAKAAHAHEFIEKLPQGYNTVIGDNGNKLSGGQKQRLSIARALLKNPQILILDEATASLDSVSEQLVQQALEKLMANRTVLIIAHRLSTIKKASQIGVIEEGQLVEIGSHQELMQKNLRYKKLVSLQS